jgi:hypothetical protein
MAWVRILVDGYSLLHKWPALAPRQPRHSQAARDELVRCLTRYQDAVGTPVSVFFDGGGARRGPREAGGEGQTGVEVLFSRGEQTADQMIERAAYRFAAWGEVLVVTDDRAERDTVVALGGFACPCADFLRGVEKKLADLASDLQDHNRREWHRFRRRR